MRKIVVLVALGFMCLAATANSSQAETIVLKCKTEIFIGPGDRVGTKPTRYQVIYPNELIYFSAVDFSGGCEKSCEWDRSELKEINENNIVFIETRDENVWGLINIDRYSGEYEFLLFANSTKEYLYYETGTCEPTDLASTPGGGPNTKQKF